MKKEIFIERKDELIKLINHCLGLDEISKQDKEALKKLFEILSQYSFENRLQIKGILSHTIIDSLDLNYTLGEKFIQFDDDIK